MNPNNGFNDLLEKIKLLPDAAREEILADIEAVYEQRPWLAMVNSAKGITNLHVPRSVLGFQFLLALLGGTVINGLVKC